MKKLFYIAALAGLFTLPSCLKNNPAEPAGALKFPTTQGDYWVYKVTDNQKNTVDTVTVSVVGSMKNPSQSGNFTILQLKWPDKIDSIYVSSVNDTLAFYKHVSWYSPQDGYVMTNLIVYPLSIGGSYNFVQIKYTTHGSLDAIKMISSQNINININKTKQSFIVFREEKIFQLFTMTQMGQYRIFTDDFAPGIGIIKETIAARMGNDGPGVVGFTWQLLYSNLSNPPSPAL